MSDRLADAVLALALAIAVLLQLLLADAPGISPASVIGGLALTIPLAWRRRAPLGVIVVFASAALVQELFGGGLYHGQPPLVGPLLAGGVAFYSLGAHSAERRAQAGLAIGVAGLWATVVATGQLDLQSFVFSGGLVALAPWLAGRTTRARALRLAAVEREQEQRGLTAASEERHRIARELHDVVAHGVVLMVLQAQGARRILDSDPERARAALAAIEDTGQTALAEIRQSLGLLRDEGDAAELRPQRTLGDLDDLVAEMREAGLGVDLTVAGQRRELAVGVDRAAYRVIQEALTNAIRHAGAVPARVTVSYEPDDLLLEIADDGPAPAPAGDGGNGILGMRERVRLHGGELDARPGPDRGFVVRARNPAGAMSIRVLLVDDHALARTGFRMVLDVEPDIEVVGEAATGRQAVHSARRLEPDVVLMDVRMPELDGIAATREIVTAADAPRVLVLTTFDLDEYVYDSLAAGASGFLLKDVGPEQLVHAIRVVAAGEALLAPSVTRRLLGEMLRAGRRHASTPPALEELTPRELEVLQLVAQGLSNGEIAAELAVEETTVKTHVSRLLSKLGLRDRTQAVVLAYESGLAARTSG